MFGQPEIWTGRGWWRPLRAYGVKLARRMSLQWIFEPASGKCHRRCDGSGLFGGDIGDTLDRPRGTASSRAVPQPAVEHQGQGILLRDALTTSRPALQSAVAISLPDYGRREKRTGRVPVPRSWTGCPPDSRHLLTNLLKYSTWRRGDADAANEATSHCLRHHHSRLDGLGCLSARTATHAVPDSPPATAGKNHTVLRRALDLCPLSSTPGDKQQLREEEPLAPAVFVTNPTSLNWKIDDLHINVQKFASHMICMSEVW